MYTRQILSVVLASALGAGVLATARAEESDALEAKLELLLKEIRNLQQQLDEQKRAAAAAEERVVFHQPAPVRMGENVIVSGEGAVTYWDTQGRGRYPHNEFRVDEARLFLDAQLHDHAFFYVELNLTEREGFDDQARIGELYVDLEDLSRWWGREYPLTLRAGRMDIPFGEEYRHRDAIDNPLISHSLSDIWGVDEGVELFGEARGLDYVFAVQNGGYKRTTDGDPDKALVARVGAHPTSALRVSASWMRTGDLDVKNDELGEVWFGNEYLRPIGDAATTQEFHAELAELDARYTWKQGHVAAAVGRIEYDDDDSAADHSYDASYYYVEALQMLYGKWYGAARYSAIHSDDGVPVTGQGPYVAGPMGAARVEDIWRLSLGLGYRWSEKLVFKTEYSFEEGDRSNGDSINKRNQFAAEVAFGF